MYAEELFVHDGCEWEGTKGGHASFVDRLGILSFA